MAIENRSEIKPHYDVTRAIGDTLTKQNMK